MVPTAKLQRAPKYGTITLISSSPQVKYFLDGKYVGDGQRRVLRRVPVGKHRLHAVINGQKSPTRDVQLQPEQRMTLTF